MVEEGEGEGGGRPTRYQRLLLIDQCVGLRTSTLTHLHTHTHTEVALWSNVCAAFTTMDLDSIPSSFLMVCSEVRLLICSQISANYQQFEVMFGKLGVCTVTLKNHLA